MQWHHHHGAHSPDTAEDQETVKTTSVLLHPFKAQEHCCWLVALTPDEKSASN